MIALRREEDGHWQVLDGLQASTAPPMRAADLADCLDALPNDLLVVHREAGFSFRERPAAWQPIGAEASPDDLPTPDFGDSESEGTADSRHSTVQDSPDY